MKIKQKNEATGEEEEIEVTPTSEVDTKVKEAEDKVKAEYDTKIAEKDTALSTLDTEKKALELKLGGVKEDHPNFKILKDALEKKDEDIKKLREDIDGDKNARKADFQETIIAKVTKGDKDLEEKIKFHLANTVSAMKDGTQKEHAAKIEAAIKLASDNSNDQSILDNVMGGMGGKGGDNKGGEGKVEFTPREKALGAKLGITEEDYKKYGPKVTKRS